MVEFKVAEDSGDFWFIEINPRLWGSLPLAVSAGVNFPKIAIECAVTGYEAGKAFYESSEVRTQWKGKWLLGDM